MKRWNSRRYRLVWGTIWREIIELLLGRRAINRSSKFIVCLLPCGLSVLLFLLLASVFFPPLASPPARDNPKLSLHDHWTLQSSCLVKAAGEQISAPEFRTTGWHGTSVPSTVVAALVADKTYPDPFFGMNLRSIPGTTYPIGKNFAELPMHHDSP